MEDFTIDSSATADVTREAVMVEKTTQKKRQPKKEDVYSNDGLINCLRNETITVQFVRRENSGIVDKRHPYYGGKAEGSFTFITVPILKNGTYKNVLTNSEKAFLEDYMGLEYNALSVHKSENNYWDNYMVRLGKEDRILHLDDPRDYIDYKVLLANEDYVAGSLSILRDKPKRTYMYVLVSNNEVYSTSADKTSTLMKCFKEFGKVEDNADTLRCIIETIDGRRVDVKSSLTFLKERIFDLINSDPKRFLNVITDELLGIKVDIMKAVEYRIISRKSNYYYYENTPLCNNGEESTFAVAAKYLSSNKNQALLYAIQAKINSFENN